MSGTITVVEAATKRHMRDFLNLPYVIQGNNPKWVPPLRSVEKELLDEKKNPFFEYAKMRNYVAYQNGKAVGRISAISNPISNKANNENACHFGFFDCINDKEVAAELFKVVEDAGREWNHEFIRGPFNPNVNETMGILVDAFELPPVVMMTYNPPYYKELVEAAGYDKAMDVFGYLVRREWLPEKLERGAQIVRKRSKLNFRHMSKKTFDADAQKIWKVYNTAWEQNWASAPMTDKEFALLVKNLRQFADLDMVNLAENDKDELVGFSLALPDMNQALIKIRNGRLFPFGLPRLLWHTRPGAIDGLRVIIMGVLPEYRNRGIDTVFHYDNFTTGKVKGYDWAEMGWILETNTMMNRAAKLVGAKCYKTYRMFEKPLEGPWA